MRRNIIFIGIGIIAIILIVLFPVASTITGKSRDAAVEKFNAKISQIEKRYPALHKPKHLPSKKDAAIAPEETADTNGSHEDSIKAYKRLFKKAKSSGIDAGSSLLFINHYGNGKEGDREKIIKLCADNQEFILELRSLAATGGPFVDIDSLMQYSVDAILGIHKFHDLAFLLEAHAALAIENGNYEEAGKDAIAIVNFAGALGEQPFYMSQEESARLIDILFSLVAGWPPEEKMPSELADRITDYTLRFNSREVLADAMAFYTWQSREMFDNIRDRRVEDFDAFSLFYSTAGRSLLNRDQLISMGFGERASEAVRLPFYEGYVILEEIQEDIEDTPWIYFFSRFATGGISLPMWLRISDSCACQESQLGLMQIGFALEMYQEQRGEYPQNLEDITPILGCSPPKDPYTGQSFVYEPHQDSFTLYSARGNLIPSKETYHFQTDENGNIVWRYKDKLL